MKNNKLTEEQKEYIIKELDKLNKTLSQIIGRITPGLPPDREAHKLAIQMGIDIDNLINQLL